MVIASPKIRIILTLDKYNPNPAYDKMDKCNNFTYVTRDQSVSNIYRSLSDITIAAQNKIAELMQFRYFKK
jgi:hypothetical protein